MGLMDVAMDELPAEDHPEHALIGGGTASPDRAIATGVEESAPAPDDRFVPVRSEDLAVALAADTTLFPTGGDAIVRLHDELERVMCQESSALRRALDRVYATLNPDRDTIAPEHGGEAEADAMVGHLAYLLEKTNFERLGRVDIDRAMATANTAGVRVRVRWETIERLEVFVRGRGSVMRRRRTVRSPIHGVEIETEVYRRVAVCVRMHGTAPLVLKLFRDIPVTDLEALLPHAEIQMSLLDRAKVYGGGAGALAGTATKLFTAASSGFLWALLVGVGGYSVKSFMGYRRTKGQRDAQRTRHLYYRGMANNAAVLHALCAMLAQEETKEALLAYALLAAPGRDGITTRDGLDHAVEAWLHTRYKTTVNFDGPDAIESLDRLRLWTDRDQFRVCALDEAIKRLHDYWASRRGESYHPPLAERFAVREIAIG